MRCSHEVANLKPSPAAGCTGWSPSHRLDLYVYASVCLCVCLSVCLRARVRGPPRPSLPPDGLALAGEAAAARPFHSFSLPTPAMLSRLSGSCGRGGSVGAGRSGSLFAHGSGMSRSRSGSSCANLRVLYAGSVLAVLCDAFASAACPVSGAGLAMFCHFCGEPMTSSCSAAVTSAPCRNSTGRRVPCRLLHCCQLCCRAGVV